MILLLRILLSACFVYAEVCPNDPSSDGTCGSSESAAKRLAALLNSGISTIVEEHMSPSELESALGSLEKTPLGWHRRIDSFLEHLEYQNEYLQVASKEVHKLTEESFDKPVLVTRSNGGLAKHVTKQFNSSKLLKHEVTVRPSRCLMLPVGFGPPAIAMDGEYNPELQPFAQCSNCTMSLRQFTELTMDSERRMTLGTPAQDDINIQLQTHGIRSDQLPWLDKQLRKYEKALFKPNALTRYFEKCINPPAIGAAGSLRGLPFHAHAAAWNEAIVGRKLFALFPPRQNVKGVSVKCGWPPWASSGGIETALDSIFNRTAADRVLSASKDAKNDLRSCLDMSVTPLQWLVHEYPKLPSEERPMLVMMKPGEVLWIPDSWLHFTLNLDDAFYIYHATCQDQRAASFVTKERAKKAAETMCARANRFCNYCHWFCTSCEESKLECGLSST